MIKNGNSDMNSKKVAKEKFVSKHQMLKVRLQIYCLTRLLKIR